MWEPISHGFSIACFLSHCHSIVRTRPSKQQLFSTPTISSRTITHLRIIPQSLRQSLGQYLLFEPPSTPLQHSNQIPNLYAPSGSTILPQLTHPLPSTRATHLLLQRIPTPLACRRRRRRSLSRRIGSGFGSTRTSPPRGPHSSSGAKTRGRRRRSRSHPRVFLAAAECQIRRSVRRSTHHALAGLGLLGRLFTFLLAHLHHRRDVGCGGGRTGGYGGGGRGAVGRGRG